MPPLPIFLKYLHILAAMTFVAGALGAGLLMARAGRATDPARRGETVRLAQFFATRLLVPGAVVAGILGLLTAITSDIPILSGWVLYALIVYAIGLVTGVTISRPHGDKLVAAVDRDDQSAVETLLREPRPRMVGMLNILYILILVYLMVFKPA